MTVPASLIAIACRQLSERVLVGLDLEARHPLLDMLSLVKKNLLAINRDSPAA